MFGGVRGLNKTVRYIYSTVYISLTKGLKPCIKLKFDKKKQTQNVE